MNPTKLMFSRRETAATLRVSLRTIDNLIGRKELVARRVGRRVLVPAQALEQFVRRDHVQPTGETPQII
jgi:excisionase family DNA binding protein